MSGQQKHSERKNVRILEILEKSRSKPKSKSKPAKRELSNDIMYDTDSKKPSQNNSRTEAEELRAVVQGCGRCMEKVSQFSTKKPKPRREKQEKYTQTLNKPFLVDLIEQRVTDVCQQNRKLGKLLMDKEAELLDRQSQVMEIEDKFTSILYTLGQELSQLKVVSSHHDALQTTTPDIDTPAYLKALLLDK